MPVGIEVVAPNHSPWGFRFEEGSHQEPDAVKFLQRTKEAELTLTST